MDRPNALDGIQEMKTQLVKHEVACFYSRAPLLLTTKTLGTLKLVGKLNRLMFYVFS